MTQRIKTKLGDVHIRWMIWRDMDEVMAIERESFEFPWFEEEFIKCLRVRNCIGMVAEHKSRVVGFMIYELEKSLLRFLNLAVAKDCRGQGVGWAMVAKLKAKLSEQRRTQLCFEVSEGNTLGHLFLRRQGFLCTKILHGWYEDHPGDAYLFEYFHDAEECDALWQMIRVTT